MGAYNELKIGRCENCQSDVEIRIQFKYGDVWQYEYKMKDVLKWGGNDTGISDARKVILDGIAARCEICGKEVDYVIHLEFNKIKSIERNLGQYHFCSEPYIIVER